MKIRLNKYVVTNPLIKDNITCISISDIHSNIDLLNKLDDLLKSINPKFILIEGDIFDSASNPNNKVTAEYLISLSKKYKIILGLGNHDRYVQKSKNNYIDDLVNKSKIIMLDFLSDGYKYKGMHFKSLDLPLDWYKKRGENRQDYMRELEKYTFDSKEYNVLISHSPNGLINKLNILTNVDNLNLVLSGHNHGGLMPRILRKFTKKNRGLVGPYNRPFYVGSYGMYKRKCTKLVINDGLTKISDCNFKPVFISRFFNKLIKPDIDIIEFKNGEDNIKYKHIRKYKV